MKIAFLFSGQGAQFPGMMKDIAEHNNEARKVFEIADKTLGRSISELCFNGTEEELALTHNTQPCVLAADLAAYKAVVTSGIKPDIVAGFSLGEYAALVAAGVIDINDIFPLIQKRADYMQEAVPLGHGGMAAIMKLTSEEVHALCDEVEGYVVPANYNCPGQIVVSGELKAIDKICEIAKEKKIKAIKLAVSAPFHCELMEIAAERLAQEINVITFNKPNVPIYMNVDAKVEMDAERIREKVLLQTKSPVHWKETIINMLEAGVDTFIEFGPGKTLSGFLKKTVNDSITVLNVSDLDSVKSIIDLR